jgi:hypothetical protein
LLLLPAVKVIGPAFYLKTSQIRISGTMKRVVVTGIGVLSPLGNTLAEYRENLEKGFSGASPITQFDATLGGTPDRPICTVRTRCRSRRYL